MGEVVIVSLVGMLVFGGLFLFLCPEWWSNSLGTIKEKQQRPETQVPEAGKQGTPVQAGEAASGVTASERAPAARQ